MIFMNNVIRLLLFGLTCMLIFFSCNKTNQTKEIEESILKGSATVFVDETLVPIIDDQVAIFESKYDAKITTVAKSESELLLAFFKEKSGIAVLSRSLTEQEAKVFKQNKINPKTTKFATDAIAIIANKGTKDTLIEIATLVDYLKGEQSSSIKGLVFDNPNSSTVRYLQQLAGISSLPNKGIYSFKTNNDVIKFVAENDGMLGVVGLNWLTQPMPAMQEFVNRVISLSVKGINSTNFYAPSQNNIAEIKYPLARDLYIINAQGYSGLGMGFSSFIAGDIGQRIVLKSGLLPVRVPGRKLSIRKEIIKEKK
jgi:phosphate transport system substrate-binding protein